MKKEMEKSKLSIEVAEFYYQLNYSQQQISEHLKISRPTVSRLLQYAREKGYVQIKIADPFVDLQQLEQQLAEKYHLKEACVAFSPASDPATILHYVSIRAAEYVSGLIRNGMSIGISWGSTIYEVAAKLPKMHVKGAEVVQLKGGTSFSHVNTYAWETLMLFGNALQTLPVYFPLPLLFEKAEAMEIVMQDQSIQKIIEKGREAQAAIFTVGAADEEALLFKLGYFTEAEKEKLMEKAVGDVCSRFIDRNGEICDTTINKRTVSIELAELRKKEWSILVAGGRRKVLPAHTALTAGYANVLITDQHTAKQLLGMEQG
ncbi:sugar-binding transcriptional regulator [Heyndrickxia faecalis]|uniref:sugar-binding transcriptional regulator n=1 Tax=Heyndrickxia faecalis TaxID=2824910 RepID=UPI0031FDB1DC